MMTLLRDYVNLWVEAPAACHPRDRSCDHKHCDSGDIMFLICLMTSRQHVFNGLYLIYGWIPFTVFCGHQ